MKNNTITVRLTEEERALLSDHADQMGLTTSQYIRELIHDSHMTTIDKGSEIITRLCELYVIVQQQGLSDCEELMKGIDAICQILS